MSARKGASRSARDEFAAVLDRVQRDRDKPPQVRGAAVGMLWAIGQASPEQVLAEMLLLSDPEHLGDFLAGLFALAREVAQRHPQLVEAIDRLIMEYSAEEFQQTLPALRLAFTYFTPREKHYMLTTLFEALGLKRARAARRAGRGAGSRRRRARCWKSGCSEC